MFRKSVTFLYKLVRGVSPKSYGIHVAHMAGIPLEIINNAAKYSDKNSVKELSKCDSHLDRYKSILGSLVFIF